MLENGTEVISETKTYIVLLFSLIKFVKPNAISLPINYICFTQNIYFPLPQPISPTSELAGRLSKKFLTLGHGLYQVWLKCTAIELYTS